MLNSTYAPARWSDVEASKVETNVFGFAGTATANTTTNFDQKIADDCLVKGIFPVVQNMNFGDSFDIYTVDIDGILGPSGTILKHPVSSFYVQTTQQAQKEYHAVAPFKILGGLYVRFAYKNTSLITAAQVQVNLELLKVLV